MKISTAIALGRTMIKPLGGTRRNTSGDSGCAIGMAESAIGYPARFEAVWPSSCLKRLPLPCGCSGNIMLGSMAIGLSSGRETLISAIVHLFNFHVMTAMDWTLDQLIDWVASVEPQDPEEVNAEAEAKAAIPVDTREYCETR